MSEGADFSKYSRIIPLEKLEALKLSLRKVPDYSWLLKGPHPSEERLQGDIIADCPTTCIDDNGTPRSRSSTVMVLNNTCDLPDGRGNFVTVAPVFDFEAFVRSEVKNRPSANLESYFQSLRCNKKTEFLYLPSFATFKDGALVALDVPCAVSSKIYQRLIAAKKRIASFSQIGFYFFLIKLTSHIARPESSDVTREDAET